MRRLGKATHDLTILDSPLSAHRIGHLLNFGGEWPAAGQPEQITEAVLLAEVHGLGTGIVTVAADVMLRETASGRGCGARACRK